MDPQMKDILDHLNQFHSPSIEDLTPPLARQLPDYRDVIFSFLNEHPAQRLFSGLFEDVGRIEHHLIPGPQENLMARIYFPKKLEGLSPAILMFHDGGFVLGNLNRFDRTCRALMKAANCILVSVGYRQAPENKYPAAREDAFAAWEWLLSNAPFLGVDPESIAIGGLGSGGNLAALVCLMARERKFSLPIHQLLIAPILDSNTESRSYLECEKTRPLCRDTMRWFLKQYLTEAQERFDPWAFPLKQANLRDLPPTTLLLAEIDPLRTEGEAYAEELKRQGNDVFLKVYPGVTHGFFELAPVLDAANEALRDAAERLSLAFEDAVELSELQHLSHLTTEGRPLA